MRRFVLVTATFATPTNPAAVLANGLQKLKLGVLGAVSHLTRKELLRDLKEILPLGDLV